MSEITASPRSDISGNGGHRSGGDEIKTTCGEKKAESDEYETATGRSLTVCGFCILSCGGFGPTGLTLSP